MICNSSSLSVSILLPCLFFNLHYPPMSSFCLSFKYFFLSIRLIQTCSAHTAFPTPNTMQKPQSPMLHLCTSLYIFRHRPFSTVINYDMYMRCHGIPSFNSMFADHIDFVILVNSFHWTEQYTM